MAISPPVLGSAGVAGGVFGAKILDLLDECRLIILELNDKMRFGQRGYFEVLF